MFSSGDEDGSGGVLASHDELVAQYQTTRIRALGWAGYKRIFQLTKASVLTLNPDTFSVTNTFRYDGLNNVVIDEKSPDQFVFEYDKTTYTFKTAYREHLLCQLFECIARAVPNKLKVTGPIECERLRKNGTHIDCKLSLTYHGIVESDPYENVIQEYKWVNITRCGTDDASSGFFFEHSGRTKIFLSANIDRLINGCRTHLRFLGRDKVPILLNQPLSAIVKYRLDLYASIPAGVSVFDVNKITKRSPRPMPRQLHISEVFIKETDSSGFQTMSFMRVDAIYAIVRSWNSLREFTIEYNDGSSRTYTSTVRDTLLAMLLDVCHATGNVRAIVTGEVSDGLRLMPRFAEEDYKASLKDTFFGASSIEAWFLGRLVKLFKNLTGPINNEEVIKACREFNANVPCPGLTPTTELLTVKSALTGVLMTLQSELLKAFHNDRLDNSRELAIILQTLFRLIPCTHGYKAFVEVKEVDTRQLLLQLLRYDNDFVHYWTLELLMVLCRCPLEPRNMQQEFVNKHTLLTDKTLKYLTELMYYKTEEEEQAEALYEKVEAKSVVEHIDSGDAASAGAASGPPVTGSEQHSSDAVAAVATAAAVAVPTASGTATTNDAPASRLSRRMVAGNPSPAAHIPVQSFKREASVDIAVRRVSKDTNTTGPVVGSLPGGSDGVHFTPNALLVIGAASLLESLLCSRRDTSSPELINQILDLLAERTDVLINMLRSTSFLIMENASILMFSLLKNRPAVAPVLREMALSDCLVLKNFYNAVFSPSASQRYISRFLVATWMSGPERSNPAKALLMRVLPSGLVEYLKFAAITEDHRKNLDAMEDEFYATFANAGGGKAAIVSASSDLLQSRMRKRIAAALKEKAGPPSASDPLGHDPAAAAAGTASVLTSPVKLGGSGVGGGGGGGGGGGIASSDTKKLPENYRIMFHVMTQDHKLPDLIWNEQTRLELRTALETEIKEYEREQRLLNHKKIAWNYQQFAVKYESLREELQVGPIYIRYFLEAGEAFLRTLENPNHIVLFEKLFRRVLVNVEHQPHLSILCVRCLTRLYEVCGSLIGPFDDMLLMVKLLEQATNLELQQCLLDLLVALSWDERNLSQLLDKHVVNTLMTYVTLAHINPDQIGNALARATAKVLLIQDAGVASATAPAAAAAGGAGGAAAVAVDDGSRTDEDIAKQVRRSMWVPEDIACPKVWFAAPPGTLPPPKQVQRGPYRVSELLDALDHGHIGADWVLAALTTDEGDDNIDASDRFEALVDTGRWQTLDGYFQLRLQMLYPGKALYSPAQVAAQALKLLQRLAAIHRSSNSKSLPFYPIPLSKKLMSEPWHLNVFAQLLLSNDAHVVDNAAELLCSLVEFNTSANTKLYLSGAFFFAARYTGNNFFPLARLFHLTHLRQSFHDSAASVAQEWSLVKRSILGMFLPHAMIAVLLNYGPEKFASIFTGEYDTPEVIWNADARRHLVEMVHQHIGDFPARIRQYTMSTYEYVPMATVHYAALDQEIYVHEYYLRNLCDEGRFPEWPIVDPLALLRECIQRWREEMAKGVVDTSISDAKKTLRLGDRYDNAQLRRAYKNLAREYHPDKNPQGRAMFEQIQLAYELLSKVELHATETNLTNVYLLMQTQNILYRRYPDRIGDQKYPAYPLIVSVLRVPPLREVVRGLDADLLLAGTKLLYYTTAVSPLNAKEFVRTGCVAKAYEILAYAVSLRPVVTAAAAAVPPQQGEVLCRELLTYVMKTFTSIVHVEEGREAVLALCPRFAEDLYDLLLWKKQLPIVVEQALEVIARCASLAALQRAFIDAGLVWRLVPLLLEYDGTFAGGDYQDESQRVTYNQCAANVLAIVATKALGRLGGYMFDELRSPVQDDVKRALSALLTQPLAMLLRNRRPWELLNALNENVETTTKIWNVAMRKEVMAFLQRTDGSRLPGSHDDDLVPANDFVFSNLRDELCVNGVYVRIFNKTADTNDVLDPSQFCRELLQFVARTLAPAPLSPAAATATVTATATAEESPVTATTVSASSTGGPSVTATYATLTAVARKHIDYTAEALRLLAESKAYIPHDMAQAPRGLETIFLLLELPPEVDAFVAAAKMLSMLFAAEEFIVAFAERTPSITWRLVKCLLTIDHANALSLWTATEALVANPVGLQALLDAGAIARILGGLLAVKGYVSNYPSRLAAMSLLTKMLWNQNKGSDVHTMLCRFLPRPLVTLIRNKAGSASLHVLDTVCENPELIWTAEMQGELRDALVHLLGPVEEARKDPSRGFQQVPVISAEYAVPYRQLAQELYLGNVYIRVFLKQPTFRLTNAVFFMEKVTEFWESSFAVQVTPPPSLPTGGVSTPSASSSASSSTSDSTELILGKEDFLSLLTSCMICVMKGEATIVDHLISWGFVQKMLELMGRALHWERRGSPLVCILRLLHTMILRGDVLDNIAVGRVDLIALLKETLEDPRGGGGGGGGRGGSAPAAADGDAAGAAGVAGAVVTLSKDATLVVDLLKRIFQNGECRLVLSFVEAAKRCHLVSFLLDHVLHVDTAQLAYVVHPSALKIHAVDCIKAILTLDPEYEAGLQSFLALHPAWREYRDQSHDLFLTDKEKTDIYLIQDASDAKFAALLLTDGANGDGTTTTKLTNMFPSTGPHADRGSSAASTAHHSHRGSMRTQSKFAPGSAASTASQSTTDPLAPAPAPAPAAAPAVPPTTTGTATWAPTPIAPPVPPSRPVHLDLPLPVASQPLPTLAPPVPATAQPLRPPVLPQSQPPQAPQAPQVLTSGSTATTASARPAAAASSGPQQITTTVVKGEHGLGLDLTKSRDNRAVVTAFKAMPNNAPNPALQCVPPIKIGDVIVGVNGEACASFADAVKLIRATNGAVTLRLLRSA